MDDLTKNKVINKYKVIECKNLKEEIEQFDYIFIAVKPQVFLSFDDEPTMNFVKGAVKKNQVVVSIMAGVSIDKIKQFFGVETPVVRVMPNTPAFIGEAMSVLSFSKDVNKISLEKIEDIFNSIGKTEVLDEKYLDAVTGLSGAGPAYLFLFIEALIQGGIYSGLNKQVSEKLAVQTVLGAVKMIDGSKTIEELRHMVTSPGGATIEAISTLERMAFRGAVIDAVKASTDRSKELGKK